MALHATTAAMCTHSTVHAAMDAARGRPGAPAARGQALTAAPLHRRVVGVVRL